MVTTTSSRRRSLASDYGSTVSVELWRRAHELLGYLEAGLQLLAGGLVVDQTCSAAARCSCPAI